MGTFPNAPFFALKEAPLGMDIIGVDPNDSMERYAQSNARKAGLLPDSVMPGRNQSSQVESNKAISSGSSAAHSVRVVHGVSEALPFDDKSLDAVVCSLTLCSVLNPEKSIAEIKRVLKSGGKFLFWEHVLSETDTALARQQIKFTPMQVSKADGCHL